MQANGQRAVLRWLPQESLKRVGNMDWKGIENKSLLVGRVLAGGFYLIMADGHFRNVESMAGFAAAKGVPAASLLIVVAGVLLLIGGLSILLGFKPKMGVVAIVVFFVPVTFIMHDFWAIEDSQLRQMQMVQFLKNTALLGSALMFAAVPTPWSLSVDAHFGNKKETE